jgi:hypothetical protein
MDCRLSTNPCHWEKEVIFLFNCIRDTSGRKLDEHRDIISTALDVVDALFLNVASNQDELTLRN